MGENIKGSMLDQPLDSTLLLQPSPALRGCALSTVITHPSARPSVSLTIFSVALPWPFCHTYTHAHSHAHVPHNPESERAVTIDQNISEPPQREAKALLLDPVHF